MKQFKINDYLALKLEEYNTNIYVKNQLFRQCRFLMLNIPVEEAGQFAEIDSIDEVADKLGWAYDGQIGVEYEIDPETEFWGHCSNLQTWYENDYDTRLLHGNLSFPLLKKLTEVGDPLAKKVFKEEIAMRFESAYPSVVLYITKEKLLNFLDDEERVQLVEKNLFQILKKMLENGMFEDEISDSISGIINKLIGIINGTEFYEMFDRLIDYNENAAINLYYAIDDSKILSENIPIMLKCMKKIKIQARYEIFYFLVSSLKDTNLIKDNFSLLIDSIGDLPENARWEALHEIYGLIKGTGFLHENLPFILETLKSLPIESRIDLFSHVVKLIKGSETFSKFYGELKSYYIAFFEALRNLPNDNSEKFNLYFALVTSLKNTSLFNELFDTIEQQYLDLLKNITSLHKTDQCDIFPSFINLAKKTELMKKHKSLILKTFPKLPNSNTLVNWFKNVTYTRITETIKDTESENEEMYQKWINDFSSA